MRILGDLHGDRDAGPMPLWQRWLCALLLGVTAPLWVSALLVTALACAIRSLITNPPED